MKDDMLNHFHLLERYTNNLIIKNIKNNLL